MDEVQSKRNGKHKFIMMHQGHFTKFIKIQTLKTLNSIISEENVITSHTEKAFSKGNYQRLDETYHVYISNTD